MALACEDGEWCSCEKGKHVPRVQVHDIAASRVLCIEHPHPLFPTARVFAHEVGNAALWQPDALASWHFSTFGTGILTVCERSEALSQWLLAQQPIGVSREVERF